MTDDRPVPGPYDLAFGADDLDDQLFPPIADEAAARDAPLDDPDRFLFLGSVGRLVQAVAGEASSGGEAMRQHGRFIFHAFHHWRAGRREVALEAAALRAALDAAAAGEGSRLTVPAPAGYFRLPRNLVWATASHELQPEPAHGFFWTLLDESSEPPWLHLFLTLGVRADRPGFSAVPVSGQVDSPAGWADADARPDGDDFASTIPGGELDRLYSLETSLELLKLASRAFLALDARGPGP